MNIALLGYGKMGKVIESIALHRGHSIVLKIDADNAATITDDQLSQADVAIEFSTPQTVIENIHRCFRVRVPIVVGTTGWNTEFEAITGACRENNAALFHASNFSLGVNLFFRLNKQLAKLMQPHLGYTAALEEIHHIHKLDAPSGTALTLVEGLQKEFTRQPNVQTYLNVLPKESPPEELAIVAKRIAEVPGTHTVSYTSTVDRISITHEAFNRDGFALGAVLAAEWIPGRKGVFGMDDLLGD